MTLDQFNRLPLADAVEKLSQCCASTRWIEDMVAERPFEREETLFLAADRIWEGLTMPDFLEAFEGHTEREERDTSPTANPELQTLAEYRAEYKQRFGFDFVLCTAGMNADNTLYALKQRLDNSLIDELSIAASEQAKLIRLNLEKLLSS